jgi:tRNA1Val (adenine37-N6)-methyltransferase
VRQVGELTEWTGMTKNEIFRFRQFTIRQDRCAMKVGTDGVLLGAWADGGKRILDVGTGTGIIALMMAQRYPDSLVDALEMDAEAAAQASENVQKSEFAEHIQVINERLQAFSPLHDYDAIVSNPPFFVNSLASPDAKRAWARNAETLSAHDLFAFAKSHLTDEGTLSMVIPADQVGQMIGEASLAGMRLSRKVLVKTTPRKPYKRALIAFSHCPKTDAEIEEHNLLNADGTRSPWYDQLTSEFYL